MKTQEQLFWEAHRKCADADRVFLSMINSENPITKKELRKLIEKRPGLWKRYENFLNSDILPEG